MDEVQGTGGASCAGESCTISLVGIDSSWFSFSVLVLVSKTASRMQHKKSGTSEWDEI